MTRGIGYNWGMELQEHRAQVGHEGLRKDIMLTSCFAGCLAGCMAACSLAAWLPGCLAILLSCCLAV